MANYSIIGGDGKEYGPVTEADVRQWISEGRLSGESRAKAESDAEFRALAQFPEFAGAFAASAPATIAPAGSATDYLERDYELDLGGCISSGYEEVKKNFGTLFVSALILLAIQFGFPGLLNTILVGGLGKIFTSVAAHVGLGLLAMALGSTVLGPLLGGVNLIYLKTIRGQATGVGEIFAGFQKCYAQLFLGSLVVTLIIGACMVPFNFVISEKVNPLVQQLQHLPQPPAPTDVQNILSQMVPAFVSALPIFFICLIPVTYLTICWLFTLPLIIDKQLEFGAAMKTSWKKVNQHWWQVFGLTILVGLVSLAGVLACCIGALFTVPIGLAALMIAYETIFGARKN
jgi:hypothetical protein